MDPDLAFILGLLDRQAPSCVSHEDFLGTHAPALRLWQRLGFLAREPERNPVPSCPHCCEGVPYPLGGRYVCGTCQSPVDPRHLLLWRFHLEAFLTWLAGALHLGGTVRFLDDHLWQLGSHRFGGLSYECFFCRSGPLSPRERMRLLSFRNAVLLRAVPWADVTAGFKGPSFLLPELLHANEHSMTVVDLNQLLGDGGEVRFDEQSGGILAGSTWLGDVALATKEYHLLTILWRHVNELVPYRVMKEYVLAQTGSSDTTDEATFCHKLKNRLKQTIPQIDLLIRTTNKGEGYMLRAFVHWV